MKTKLFALVLVLSFLLGCVCVLPALAEESDAVDIGEDDIVVLYTNDVHSYINNEGLSYDNVAALKKEMLQMTDNVLLADAGDHVQGTPYGSYDKGASVIGLMNAAGYDIATYGNHEVDYSMDALKANTSLAEFEYVSCSFMDLKAGTTLVKPYKIFELGSKKVAFVGISTPEMMTSTFPTYFQDENGNYLYDIPHGEELYAYVQSAIDEAKARGADHVIALGHLGVDGSSESNRSTDVIANTTGLDAFIDGHSHTEVLCEKVTDKSGNEVVLTQTGSYLSHIGRMIIRENGDIEIDFVSEYEDAEQAVSELAQDCIDKINELLGEKIAESEVGFTIFDEEGKRAVRVKETNMADFVTDSFYYYINIVDGVGCDATIVNGGGVRANADMGDWNYFKLKEIQPFENIICVVEVTGKDILDVLEFGAIHTTGKSGENENGSFMSVSGITYQIDTSIEPSVVVGEDGETWLGSPTGDYRVHSVKIYNKETGAYEPLDLDKTYRLGGINYILREGGSGMGKIFEDAKLIKDYMGLDYMTLAEYAMDFADSDGDGYPEISSANSPFKSLDAYGGYIINYEDSENASGRIIFAPVPEAQPTSDPTDVPDYTLYIIVSVVSAVVISAVVVTVIVIKKKKS